VPGKEFRLDHGVGWRGEQNVGPRRLSAMTGELVIGRTSCRNVMHRRDIPQTHFQWSEIMTHPTNPLPNPDSPDDQPASDPMLDAVERSIENPDGFTDPLADHQGDTYYMDDLARGLGAVEASIEGRPPMPTGPHLPEALEDEIERPEDALPDETSEDEMRRAEEDALEGPTSPARGGSSPLRERPLLPPLEGTGGGHLPVLPPIRQSIGARSGARAGVGRRIRICPESHERIDEENCLSCEKYRHWPEGTDEEPKECWYDWKARSSCTEEGDDDDAEED